MSTDHYLTVKELQTTLKVSRATVYRLLAKGLPSVKVGNARRFFWLAVEAYLKGRDVTDVEPVRSELPREALLEPGDYQCLHCGWIGHVPTPRQQLPYCPRCLTQAPHVRKVDAA